MMMHSLTPEIMDIVISAVKLGNDMGGVVGSLTTDGISLPVKGCIKQVISSLFKLGKGGETGNHITNMW